MAELVEVGTLPVSAINIGLAASVPGLSAELSARQAETIEVLGTIVDAAILELDFPPNPVTFGAAIVASNSPVEIAAAVSPAALLVSGFDRAAELVVEIGLITTQLEVVSAITASLEAGLEAGGVGGFSYGGRAVAFGERLESSTASGFGKFGADDQIQAVIIATESFASWQSFGEGVRTNAPAAPVAASEANLVYLGELSAGEWNTGVSGVLGRLGLFKAELTGAKVSAEASLQVSIGADPPDVELLVNAGADIVAELGIDGLLDNFVNVSVDFEASLGSLQVEIDASVSLIADIGAQLSAGGLTVWTYTGRAGDLGTALRAATASGLPNGSGSSAPVYGLVLAGSPASMSTFGNIFLT